MNIRLHATRQECAVAIGRLGHAPGLRVHDTSRVYPDRTGELVRVYLTVTLHPADQPALTIAMVEEASDAEPCEGCTCCSRQGCRRGSDAECPHSTALERVVCSCTEE